VEARALLFSFLLCFHAIASYPQTVDLAVSGTVHDASGAVIPGAQVTVRQAGDIPPIVSQAGANQINTHPDVVFNGSFGFSGSETGLDFADFLLGVPSSYTQGHARNFYNRNLYLAAFVQDSWKATDRLTLNYGVRWDRIRPWEEKFNQLQTLVKGEQSQVFPNAPQELVFPGDAGVPRPLAPARNNLSPRIGVAWSRGAQSGLLDAITGGAGKTSIRLGYGIFLHRV
jgi:outer membrane receptor protein involved in Fe transport